MISDMYRRIDVARINQSGPCPVVEIEHNGGCWPIDCLIVSESVSGRCAENDMRYVQLGDRVEQITEAQAKQLKFYAMRLR